MAGSSAPKRNVKFNKPEDPSFLKAFKSKVGYKEPDSIEAKFKQPDVDESKLDDREDREDEQPTVVVLKPGDLTQEEYKEVKDKLIDQKSEASPDSKILFNKSGSKRRKSSEDASGGITASTKKIKENNNNSGQRQLKDNAKGIKNSSLLSFQDDEEEDDDDNG